MLFVDTSGLERLRMQLEEMVAALPEVVQAAIEESAQWTADHLSEMAPRGQHTGDEEEQVLPGDESGPLAESFTVEMAAEGTQVRASVSTTQPAKLKLVVEGRGEIIAGQNRLNNKKALYWAGAAHPVKRVGPVEPNDFVTPALQDGIDYAQEALTAALDEVLQLLNE